MSLRADLAQVACLVPDGAKVLDLGCGDGALLRHLMDQRGCSGTGVERDEKGVLAAISADVPVIELDLDHQLDEFGDDSYDVVVLSRTLQAVHRPRELLLQMARIGEVLVVSMPNFGLWRHRLRLLTGHMPQSKDLPYSWHDTPNLHYATLVDLEALFTELGFVIERRLPLAEDGTPARFGDRAANLLAGAAIYLLRAPRS